MLQRVAVKTNVRIPSIARPLGLLRPCKRTCVAVVVASWWAPQQLPPPPISATPPFSQSYHSWFNAPLRSLQSQQAAKWQLHRVGGDGSCMFRAAAQGEALAATGKLLGPNEEDEAAWELRQAIVQEMHNRRSDIEPFLPGITDDFDGYLRQMAQDGTWGGEPEVLMASHVLRRPISVYRPGRGQPELVVTYGEEYASPDKRNTDVLGAMGASRPGGTQPMHLLWSGMHYDLLIAPQRDEGAAAAA